MGEDEVRLDGIQQGLQARRLGAVVGAEEEAEQEGGEGEGDHGEAPEQHVLARQGLN